MPDPHAPLTADEISQAVSVIRTERSLSDACRFAQVTLHEPAPGADGPRAAEAVVFDRQAGVLTEALVDLDAGSLSRWEEVPGVLPPMLLEEAFGAIEAVKANERWQKAMAERGITDLDLVQLDPWPPGRFDERWYEGDRRIARVLSYLREDPTDNGYARPVEGVMVIVDLATYEVVEVVDTGVVPLPPQRGSYFPDDVGPLRTDRAPLEITQPDGPGFTVEGNRISWQRWDLGVSMHPVQGLVLHRVGYTDGDRRRAILHRAALGEMVVPYGDTDAMHRWKNAFDVGEWGLGRLTNSLILGCDCLGEIHYLDATLADESGNHYVVENAICIHEEDFGILWKHFDMHSGTVEVRRRRRLVVSSIHTVGNYEYAFYWYFHEDGTIAHEVKMTGILQTKAVEPGTDDRHAVTVAPGLVAPHHQHLFCMRLHWDLDGGPNTVVELDVLSDPASTENPYANGFHVTEKVIEHERDSGRVVDPSRSRTWAIQNRSVRNAVGQPTAYRLLPGPVPTLLAGADSMIRRRAAFATANLWVTPWAPGEDRAAGDYPNQHDGGDGLPRFMAGNRPVVDVEGVVTWHTFGLTHIARPEDWPVMPTDPVGFTLVPFGFFDRNPALDVAPSADHCS